MVIGTGAALLGSALAGGGLGVLGNIFGNKKSARTGTTGYTNQSKTSTSSGTNYGSNQSDTLAYNEPGAYAGLGGSLMDFYQNRMNQKVPLEGYEAGGIANINRNSALIDQTLQNKLASRGLTTSPVAGAGAARLEAQRGSDISSFQNTLPLLERYYQDADAKSAADFYGRRPLGYTRTGSTTGTTDTTGTVDTTGSGTGEQVNPGSAAGNTFTGLGDIFGYLLGQGYFGGGGGSADGSGKVINGVYYPGWTGINT